MTADITSQSDRTGHMTGIMIRKEDLLAVDMLDDVFTRGEFDANIYGGNSPDHAAQWSDSQWPDTGCNDRKHKWSVDTICLIRTSGIGLAKPYSSSATFSHPSVYWFLRRR